MHTRTHTHARTHARTHVRARARTHARMHVIAKILFVILLMNLPPDCILPKATAREENMVANNVRARGIPTGWRLKWAFP